MLTNLKCSMIDLKIREHLINRLGINEQQIHDAMDLAEIHEETQYFEDYLAKLNIIDARQHAEVSPFRNIGQAIGEFTITDVVGTGAMGIVYLAQRASDPKPVALKVINKRHCDDNEFIQRFHREVAAVSHLEHEHIIHAIATGSNGEELYLATEYVDGPSMGEMLESFGPLPEAYVLQCMRQVISGLRYAYETGNLVHRDLKPANILIDHGAHSSRQHMKPMLNNDVAKVIDFGLAKQVDDDQHLTITGFALGTPYYMAPEQIRGESDVDHYIDIYSLGATMFRLLTGEYPFNGNSPGAVMLAHIMEELPDPSDHIPSLKPETVAVIKTCMAKDRSQRYANYHALEQAVDQALEACNAKATTMSVLRKPLVVKTTMRHKKCVQEADSDSQEFSENRKPKSDAQKRLQISESRIERARKKLNNNKMKSHSDPLLVSSESLLRVMTDQIKGKKSAVFEEGIEQALVSDRFVWVALAASVLFMVGGIASRLTLLA